MAADVVFMETFLHGTFAPTIQSVYYHPFNSDGEAACENDLAEWKKKLEIACGSAGWYPSQLIQ